MFSHFLAYAGKVCSNDSLGWQKRKYQMKRNSTVGKGYRVPLPLPAGGTLLPSPKDNSFIGPLTERTLGHVVSQPPTKTHSEPW